LTAADIPFGLHLCGQAGWNQRAEDWQRFLNLEPDGCFLAERDGVPVGTTTTCVFGMIAWVAMVLVDAAHRGQGIATALMRHALAYLDGRGVRTVRLDATPLGQPVYEKLGFVPSYPLARYAGTLPRTACMGRLPRLARSQLPALATLDREITGTDRHNLLERLLLEWPRSVRLFAQGGQVHGYVAARLGARAVHIGPCLGAPLAAGLLLADACHRFGGRAVYLDIPTGNGPAVQMAEALGLTVQRPLLRMSRGEPVAERVKDLWASSGPEKG
jgi:GNAT superfamily N-acetyltransferase